MSDLIVIGYPDEETAEKAWGELVKLQQDFLVDLEDAAIVRRDRKGRLHVTTPAHHAVAWGTFSGLFKRSLQRPGNRLERDVHEGIGAGSCRGQRVTPVVSVQNRYNAVDRSSETMVDLCEQETLMFLPWAPVHYTEASRAVLDAARSTWRRTWRRASNSARTRSPRSPRTPDAGIPELPEATWSPSRRSPGTRSSTRASSTTGGRPS
jgi:hypothetical protein